MGQRNNPDVSARPSILRGELRPHSVCIRENAVACGPFLGKSRLACADPTRAPFARDRLGLSLDKADAGFTVGFVAPDSPAQAAGFKVGEKIALINGKSAEVWPGTSFADPRYGPSGTDLVFTMRGGAVQQVKLTDYF